MRGDPRPKTDLLRRSIQALSPPESKTGDLLAAPRCIWAQRARVPIIGRIGRPSVDKPALVQQTTLAYCIVTGAIITIAGRLLVAGSSVTT